MSDDLFLVCDDTKNYGCEDIDFSSVPEKVMSDLKDLISQSNDRITEDVAVLWTGGGSAL